MSQEREKRILLTGFTPFGGEEKNPAWEAVRELPDRVDDAVIYKLEVPTVFGRAALSVEHAVEELHPDAVICVGQAGGRSCISVEKVAINYRNAAIPDNEGVRPVEEPVAADGPAAFFATIPVSKIVEAIRVCGIPATVSLSAGSYVCNDLFYSVLYLAERKYPGMLAGFIHVPYVPAQTVRKPAGTPSMALSLITEALEAAARTTAAHLG